MNRTHSIPSFVTLFSILTLFSTGCHPKTPSDITQEKNLIYDLEMIIPADEMADPPDVAALIHDIKEQVLTLEKGVKGEDPVFLESLSPLKQTLHDLNTTLTGLNPELEETKGLLKDLQSQIETINAQFQE